jgi:hypothetical protein
VFYTHPSLRVINAAGCVALLEGNTTPNGTGAYYQGWQDCALDACAACVGPSALDSCMYDLNTCSGYGSLASAALNNTRLSTRQTCFSPKGEPTHAWFMRVARVFCAHSAAPDADASTD